MLSFSVTSWQSGVVRQRVEHTPHRVSYFLVAVQPAQVRHRVAEGAMLIGASYKTAHAINPGVRPQCLKAGNATKTADSSPLPIGLSWPASLFDDQNGGPCGDGRQTP